MGVSGAVGFAAAANIFVGMVEAPLFVRPYLSRMTRSELFVLMTTGMATVAGTMLVLYASVLGATVPDAAGHLLVASVISAPAAITIARLMVPPGQGPGQSAGLSADEPTRAPVQIVSESSGTMDAITQGTRSGLELFLNVVAMLLVLVALVYLVNAGLSLLPSIAGAPITLERVLGIAMSPVRLADGDPVGGNVSGGGSDGHQDDPERVSRLSRPGRSAGDCAECAQPAHHDLRALRLRQPR